MKEKDLCFTEFLDYMIDNNDDAAYVIACLMNENKPLTAIALNILDDREIRGHKLYSFFDKTCDQRANKLFEILGLKK
jgi:hypothetical protein